MSFRYQEAEALTVPELLEKWFSRYRVAEERVYGEEAWQQFVRILFELYARFEAESESLEEALNYDEDELWAKDGFIEILLELRRTFDQFLDAIDREKFNRDRISIESKPTPCLFISHRSTDAAIAERVACIAQEHQYEYWLDIHDPSLGVLNRYNGAFPATLRSVLIAATIEIGLLNCTNVIALWSSKASGSEWIPYEYGRAKKLYHFPQGLWTPSAAMWVEDGVTPPDYSFLARTFRTERALRHWLGGNSNQLPCRTQTQSSALNGGRD
jgi:hypothetical protein